MSRIERRPLVRFALGLGLVLLAIDLAGCWRWLDWVTTADADHARALAADRAQLVAPLLAAQAGYLVVGLLALACLYPAWVIRRPLVLLPPLLWLLQLPASRPGLVDLAARRLPGWEIYALYPRWLGWLLLLLWWSWLALALVWWRRAFGRRLALCALEAVVLWLAWPVLRLPAAVRPLRDPARPNILILAADSLRADRLGCYGGPRPSPAIDRLAAGGVRFEAAFTDAGGTLPSWATILSGRHAPQHGLRHHFPGAVALRRFAADPGRLPALLRRAGYATAASSDWAGDIFRQTDFGFETVESFAPKGLALYLRDGLHLCHPLLAVTLCRSPVEGWFRGLDRARVLLYPESLADQTVRLVERLGRGERPFLLVHFDSAPHYPYLAARPEAGRFNAPDYRGRSRYRLAWSIDRLLFAPRPVPPEERRQALALYDAAVASFDRRAGRILQAFARAGRRPGIVVLLADHGEAFFERPGLVGHGVDFAPGDPVHRIPLLIHVPDQPPGRIDGVVRTVDLAPTIAELAGLPRAAGWQGESLVAAMRRGRLARSRVACAETTYLMAPGRYPFALVARGSRALDPTAGPAPFLALRPEFEPAVRAARLQMARRGRYKLLRIPTALGPLVLLFDTQADPGCRRDLSRSAPAVRDALLREIDAWSRPPPG